MKRVFEEDEARRLRGQLRLQIDAAAKSVAAVLQVALDLCLVLAWQEPSLEKNFDHRKTSAIPEMLTPVQAAEYLGVKPQTLGVWRSTHRYPVPFVKVGRKVFYRKADLDHFLRQRTENRRSEDES